MSVFFPLLAIAFCLISFSHSANYKWQNYPNQVPIIGILAQETRNPNKSYIAASYVKFVEAGGARVVPIHLNKSREYTREVLDSINGVLLPGGAVFLNDSMYAQVGKFILDYARDRNNAGDFFPIWATCLGFELMANYLTPNFENLVDCDAYDIALPLKLLSDATQSRLFSQLPADVLQALIHQNVTANYHRRCLTLQAMQPSGLDKLVKVLSTNVDSNNLEFVSTYESVNYPFYAVQWHPEKAPWEWNTVEKNIPHSPEAIRVTQYFASFFVNEGRKSTHHFENKEREKIELIYNINPTYTGKNDSLYEQQYIFRTG